MTVSEFRFLQTLTSAWPKKPARAELAPTRKARFCANVHRTASYLPTAPTAYVSGSFFRTAFPRDPASFFRFHCIDFQPTFLGGATPPLKVGCAPARSLIWSPKPCAAAPSRGWKHWENALPLSVTFPKDALPSDHVSNYFNQLHRAASTLYDQTLNSLLWAAEYARDCSGTTPESFEICRILGETACAHGRCVENPETHDYFCDCEEGYRQSSDRKQCVGKTLFNDEMTKSSRWF